MVGKAISVTKMRNAMLYRNTILKGIDEGMTIEHIARDYGCSTGSIRTALTILGLWDEYRKGRKTKRLAVIPERVQDMYQKVCEGMNYHAIGVIHGITRERVRQLVTKFYGKSVMEIRKERGGISCQNCGVLFTPSKANQIHCSHECAKAHRGKFTFTRDDAVRMMQMRAHSFTWEEVAEAFPKFKNATSFRTMLQRFIPLLFSTAEQEFYFRKQAEEKPYWKRHFIHKFPTPEEDGCYFVRLGRNPWMLAEVIDGKVRGKFIVGEVAKSGPSRFNRYEWSVKYDDVHPLVDLAVHEANHCLPADAEVESLYKPQAGEE